MIRLPKEYNYIGVFLTFRCRLGCAYCINKQGGLVRRKELSVDEWVKILSPIQTRSDLPITLQGGEPTEYPGFYDLVKELSYRGKTLDLLTNGNFDLKEFLYRTDPKMFKRRAPYASIRFSYHAKSNRYDLTEKVKILQDEGYSVGIWGLNHPDMLLANALTTKICEDHGIDFRLKEYLDKKHGTYKYPNAITGKHDYPVWCKPSELLFAPDGKCYPCGYLFGNEKFCYGDLTKQSLGEILNSKRYWKVIQYMQKEFNVHKDCEGCCRHDSTNKFIHDFVHRPEHINFI